MSAIAKPVPSPNPYAPPRARVRDVARPKAALIPAERSTRLGAAIVDGLIFFGMVYLPMIIGTVIGAAGAESGNASAATFMLVGLGLTLIGFIVWAWMTLRQMAATGQSLAKKYFNIKVVRTDGSPASLGNLFWKRNFLNWLLSIIPLYAIIEVLFIFAEDRCCLHDKIADTMVVQA